MNQAITVSMALASVIFALAGVAEMVIRGKVTWWKFGLLACLSITFVIMTGATFVAWIRVLS